MSFSKDRKKQLGLPQLIRKAETLAKQERVKILFRLPNLIHQSTSEFVRNSLITQAAISNAAALLFRNQCWPNSTKTDKEKKILSDYFVQTEIKECVDRWNCLALTLLVNRMYVEPSDHSRIADASLDELLSWQNSLKDEIAKEVAEQLKVASGQCVGNFYLADASIVFEYLSRIFNQAIILKHQNYLPQNLLVDRSGWSNEFGRVWLNNIDDLHKKYEENPSQAAHQLRMCSRTVVLPALTAEEVCKNDWNLEQYGRWLIDTMSYFVQKLDEKHKSVLNHENLVLFWHSYLFQVLQRAGVQNLDNPFFPVIRSARIIMHEIGEILDALQALKFIIKSQCDEYVKEQKIAFNKDVIDLWEHQCIVLFEGCRYFCFIQPILVFMMKKSISKDLLTKCLEQGVSVDFDKGCVSLTADGKLVQKRKLFKE